MCTFHIVCSFVLYHIDLYVYFLFSSVKMKALLRLYVCYNWCKIGLQCIFEQSFQAKFNHTRNSKCARNSTKFYHLFANIKIQWQLMLGPHASETLLLNDYLVKIISLKWFISCTIQFFHENTADDVFLILAKNSCIYFMGGLCGWCIM